MVVAFTGLAGLVRDGALVMRDTLGSTSRGRSGELERLRGIEGEARSAQVAIVELARHSFVTPFDRGDIQQLAAHLAESLCRMEAAVDGGIRHRIDDAPEASAELVDSVVRLAELTAQTLPQLGAVEQVSAYPEQARRLVQRAEGARRDLLDEVLADRADPLVALRTLAVMEQVVLAVRCFEQVAAVVEGIVVKGS